MKNISLQKMGGAGALLVALCTGLFVLLVLLAPGEAMRAGVPSWPLVLADYALALLGLFGLAAVPAISARVAHLSEGWIRWTSILAGLGFAVLAVMNFWQAEYERTMTVASLGPLAFEEPPEASRTASEPAYAPAWQQLVTRAPQGWLEAAAVGLWIFSVSWLARSGRLLPAGLSAIGLMAGLFSIMTALGAASDMELLKLWGLVGGGFVLTPLWFARIGLILLQLDRPCLQPEGKNDASGARASKPRKKQARSKLTVSLDRDPTSMRIWGLYGDGS